MSKTFKDLYLDGSIEKVAHKWALYLDEYEAFFKPYRDMPIALLEHSCHSRKRHTKRGT